MVIATFVINNLQVSRSSIIIKDLCMVMKSINAMNVDCPIKETFILNTILMQSMEMSSIHAKYVEILFKEKQI